MEESKKTCYCETDVLNDSMINEVEDSSVEQNSAAIQDELESNDAFKSYVKKIADNIVKDYPHIRYGQAVFNFVDERYGVSRIVQFKCGVDCFYNDECVDDFLDKCYEIIMQNTND